MSQHLPTSISYTKLEIATYIHEIADKLLPSTTSQYYLALHSLHPILLCTTIPSTTLYYKTCTKYSPVLLCSTTKLAPSRFQYATICCSKTGSRRQSKKKTILKHFLKGILKGKLLAPNLRKSADKWLSQPGCSHSNTIYNLQLQKTIVLRMQPRRQATLRQPLQCDLQPEIPKHPITTHTQPHPKQLAATVTLRQKKTTNRPQAQPSHTRGTFHRRLQPLYTEKHKVSCSGFLPKT